MHVLIALAAVVIVGRLLGRAFRYLGQPPVIVEVVGGIVLGPSLLGQVWPEAAAFLLPASVAPFLSVIAQLGIILYMFFVGLELNTGVLRERALSIRSISRPLAGRGRFAAAGQQAAAGGSPPRPGFARACCPCG
jgi:Kef-type K+ transport system membrane component KefB